jgi:hypothetical protein
MRAILDQLTLYGGHQHLPAICGKVSHQTAEVANFRLETAVGADLAGSQEVGPQSLNAWTPFICPLVQTAFQCGCAGYG